jgi:hypothetical protein
MTLVVAGPLVVTCDEEDVACVGVRNMGLSIHRLLNVDVEVRVVQGASDTRVKNLH